MLQQAKYGKTVDTIHVSNSKLKVTQSSYSSFSAALSCLLVIAVISFCLTVNRTAQAQSSLSPEKLAAVLTVVNMYLLSGREEPIDEPVGERVDLEFPELESDTFNATESNVVYAAFDLQEEGVEICFDVTVNSGNFIVRVNGEPVTASQGTDNCYVISESQQRSINYVTITAIGSGANVAIDRFELAPSYQESLNGLQRVTRGGWDGRAVRKVLKIFAFGGHATDSQIQTWADMDASGAILEMLNFDEHNLKLSPLAIGETYTDTANTNLDLGTLTGFQNYISSPSSDIPIPLENRDQYGLDGYNFDDAYNRMITVRGLNPFRQKIGFWETNYHLATNIDASVSRAQMATYYDEIMAAHEAGLPYKDVMGVAAKSAAAAMQYGHRNNEWNEVTQECECNDDFAREIHQLYYGIFGVDDPSTGYNSDIHENVTIPETAKMLTGMPVPYINDFGFALDVDFQKGLDDEEHHLASVDILGASIVGASAASKIDNLMPISIQHPESLKNLPVMIVSVLADDNLSEGGKARLRNAWAAMQVNRNFLDFIHTYAISSMFHSNVHFKYLTTHERALYIANKNNLDNLEAYFGGAYYNDGRAGRTVGSIIDDDFAGEFFRPAHNVFGGQTSTEASDSSLAFENNYNRLTDDEHHLRDAVVCDTCDLGQSWQKKWETVLPQRADGNFYVSDVAEWLWNHAVGNMDNYTELERAHLYSLLGAAIDDPGSNSDGDHAFDFNLVMCVVADHAYDPEDISPSATITDILATNRWDDFCRQNDDNTTGFLAHELTALNGQFTGNQIANSPQVQQILTLLGNETLQLNATGSQHANDGADLRKHTRERVSSALGFIFTTPFIFAEGQQ